MEFIASAVIMQSEISNAMGGKKSFRRQIREGMEFDLVIRKGLPWKAAVFLKESLCLSDAEFAIFLGLSGRKLSRLRNEKKRLSPILSDRLYRLAWIFSMAKEVIGGEDKTSEWFHKPQIGLGGQTPLYMIETEPGTNEVMKLLGRINYGVLA